MKLHNITSLNYFRENMKTMKFCKFAEYRLSFLDDFFFLFHVKKTTLQVKNIFIFQIFHHNYFATNGRKEQDW